MCKVLLKLNSATQGQYCIRFTADAEANRRLTMDSPPETEPLIQSTSTIYSYDKNCSTSHIYTHTQLHKVVK